MFFIGRGASAHEPFENDPRGTKICQNRRDLDHQFRNTGFKPLAEQTHDAEDQDVSRRIVTDEHLAAHDRIQVKPIERAWPVDRHAGGPAAEISDIHIIAVDRQSKDQAQYDSRCEKAELVGGTPAENAAITRAILNSEEHGPKRDAVLLNAGAALYIAGKAGSMAEGVQLAASLIDSGAAAQTLAKFIEVSNQ